MRSVWLGSRNDMVASRVVMLAAGGVALTGSAWPGIVTGLGIAALFGASAIEVIWTVRRGRLRRDSRLERAPWKASGREFSGGPDPSLE
jgi:Co/Zn/Cd efflux system component